MPSEVLMLAFDPLRSTKLHQMHYILDFSKVFLAGYNW